MVESTQEPIFKHHFAHYIKFTLIEHFENVIVIIRPIKSCYRMVTMMNIYQRLNLGSALYHHILEISSISTCIHLYPCIFNLNLHV